MLQRILIDHVPIKFGARLLFEYKDGRDLVLIYNDQDYSERGKHEYFIIFNF